MDIRLILSEEGIFPITRDKDGKLLKETPNTGMPYSGTIQGEGKLAGVASLFIRLAGCNLRCVWRSANGDISPCDTPHASFHIDHSTSVNITDILSVIGHNLGEIKHVVISGGEPMMQEPSLKELCVRLKSRFGVHITVETNGTIMSEGVLSTIDLVSVSPKLSNSNPTADKLITLGLESRGVFKMHEKTRLQVDQLRDIIAYSYLHGKDIQLKFVVASASDEAEIKAILGQLPTVEPADILIMPLGGNSALMHQAQAVALDMVIRNGWRFSPRLHIDIFGSKQGV
ncbi:MAG: 7-carboxy-7-deazaguanine synthase QueE [Breznakibacter sp.]|nr:7-carboxy-7-deazaguanine synthase QueE [Breznakibacter sp.]